jgi:hypothetical protein
MGDGRKEEYWLGMTDGRDGDEATQRRPSDAPRDRDRVDWDRRRGPWGARAWPGYSCFFFTILRFFSFFILGKEIVSGMFWLDLVLSLFLAMLWLDL